MSEPSKWSVLTETVKLEPKRGKETQAGWTNVKNVITVKM